MKIAYIVSGMNLTFVINELESHERAHWQVLPLASCRNTSPDNFSKLMKKWHRKALYRPPFYRQLFAVIREVAANPLRFVKTLSFLFVLLVRCPTEFAKAIYELPAAWYFVLAIRSLRMMCFKDVSMDIKFMIVALFGMTLLVLLLANIGFTFYSSIYATAVIEKYTSPYSSSRIKKRKFNACQYDEDNGIVDSY